MPLRERVRGVYSRSSVPKCTRWWESSQQSGSKCTLRRWYIRTSVPFTTCPPLRSFSLCTTHVRLRLQVPLLHGLRERLRLHAMDSSTPSYDGINRDPLVGNNFLALPCTWDELLEDLQREQYPYGGLGSLSPSYDDLVSTPPFIASTPSYDGSTGQLFSPGQQSSSPIHDGIPSPAQPQASGQGKRKRGARLIRDDAGRFFRPHCT